MLSLGDVLDQKRGFWVNWRFRSGPPQIFRPVVVLELWNAIHSCFIESQMYRRCLFRLFSFFWTTLDQFFFLNQISRIILSFSTKLVRHGTLLLLSLNYETLDGFALFLDLLEMLLGLEPHFPFFYANFIELLLFHLFINVSFDSMLFNLFCIFVVFFLISFQFLLLKVISHLNLLVILSSELRLLFKLHLLHTGHCWNMNPRKCTN